ncbi:MAG: spondin domain-containing protein [Cyanobacteria bacterium P01_A01_bin.116]
MADVQRIDESFLRLQDTSTDAQITVSIENLAPDKGTTLTPLWVGFHNGEFDTYDRGVAATPGLESLAEDGSANVLSSDFADSEQGRTDGVVGSGPIAPGAIAQQTFSVEADAEDSKYFSYASMVLPSNDFFVANGNPLAHPIFDDVGNFIGTEFYVLGDSVLDAGTEVNDELDRTTAFFTQQTPNTGNAERGVVTAATGFIPNGRILSAEQFANADFTAAGYKVAKVTVDSDAATATFSTSFSDLSQAGVDPNSFRLGKAKFTGGSSFFKGIPALYSTGSNAWVADAGGTLKIDFDQPVSDISFKAIGLESATVVVSGEVDQLSNAVDISGTDIRNTDTVNFSGRITSLELRNTAAGTPNDSNLAALDDLSYTVAPTLAEPRTVTVSIENLAPANGTSLTPLWAGFHNGLFDLYNRGEAATLGLERLAEDGNADVLGQEFTKSRNGSQEGVVGSAPIAPGETVSQAFSVKPEDRESAYFSYASMVLPSNDFFIANGDPLAHRIYDRDGNFVGADFIIVGSDVLDAGTEVNDELESTTAFSDQQVANTGTAENGVVTAATGFLDPSENGKEGEEAIRRILSTEGFEAADFTAEGYQVARVRVSAGDKNAAASARAEKNNLVSVEGDGTALQLSFEQRNASEVNEIIAIATDNGQGTIGGIAPGEPGYIAALVNGAQTVFSALQGGELANFNPTRTLSATNGQFFQFAVIQGGSLETFRKGGKGELLLATPAGNTNQSPAVSIERLADNQLHLNFRTPQGGGAGQLGDLVVKANFVSASAPLGTDLQNSAGLEVLDLRTAKSAVVANFEIHREASFDNQIGFYRVENEQGDVKSRDGGVLSVGDEGYRDAALFNRLGDVLLTGGDGETLTSRAQLAPGVILAPFLLVNGDINELFDIEAANDPDVFFAYSGANSDGAEHVRLLGDNTFGFEDLTGGGDRDFDDIVVKTTFG